MNRRCLALGLTLAVVCVGMVRAQTPSRMPTPVEDDPQPPTPTAAPGPTTTVIDVEDNDQSPYHRALLAYKTGDFQKAYDALAGTNPDKQDDRFVILESQILTELKREKDAETLLAPRSGTTAAPAMWIAMGDVLFHKRDFSRAAKYYDAARGKSQDPDLTLKLVYCDLGSADTVAAAQQASSLTPFDPKNPYDDHASYYFAHAALAQATGKIQEAENDIQAARTNYGMTVTNRYLKAYLQFFAANKSNAADITPPPPVKP